MAVIICKDLVKSYGRKRALDGVDLQLDEEKIIGLIGRNGAGKTTFLRTCAGLLFPTEGSITIQGENTYDHLGVLSQVVLAGEEISFDPSFKVHMIMTLAALHYESWDQELADAVLKNFGLTPKMKIKKMSKGMKSMLNTTIALCSRSPITIFDEPTSGLDAAHRKNFYNLIIKEFSEHPRTFIISSHLLSEIEPLLEEIVLIDEGKVVFHQSVEEVRNCLVQLEGSIENIRKIGEGKQLYSPFEALGKAGIFVKRETLSQQDHQFIQENKIEMNKVSSQDACIYLTEKGGDLI